MNGIHDLGGMHGLGDVVVEEDEPVFHEAWEGRVRGLMRELMLKGMFNLDEFRHATERLPPALYLESSYYERWFHSVELLLEEKGFEIPEPVPGPDTHVEARFAPGAAVVTRNDHPAGHTRLPRYARGKRGVVESVHGPSLLADTHAVRTGRNWEPVYTVVFDAAELWGSTAEHDQTVSLDLWQSHLEEPA